MDVLASGVASQAKRRAEENELTIGPKAEGRFKDVAQRLAYLENQAAGLLVEVVRQVNKTMSGNGLVVKNNRIELAPTPNGYVRQGVGETGVLDLGDALQEVLSIIVAEEKVTGQSITIEASYSTDGTTFTTYAALPLAVLPKARYWKFRVTLSVTQGADVVTTKTMNQIQGVVQAGKSLLDGTSVKSDNTETYPMTGQTVDTTATLYTVSFDKPTAGTISKVSFKEG